MRMPVGARAVVVVEPDSEDTPSLPIVFLRRVRPFQFTRGGTVSTGVLRQAVGDVVIDNSVPAARPTGGQQAVTSPREAKQVNASHLGVYRLLIIAQSHCYDVIRRDIIG
jgi:hypothetical protein